MIGSGMLEQFGLEEAFQGPTKKSPVLAALWGCDTCHVWWGSEQTADLTARYVLRLAEPYTDMYLCEDCRGWLVAVDDVPVCPECGLRVGNPRFVMLQEKVSV